MTQLYSIPPWAAAWGFSMLIAILSDKLRHRFAFTVIPMLIAMAGFAILLNVHGIENRQVQYGALFMVTCGCYSAMPVVVCWFVMNLGGHRRRGVGTAWQIGFGNGEFNHILQQARPLTLAVGGIISTYAFLKKDDSYRNGYIISVSFLSFSAACCISYFMAIWTENRRRDRAAANGTAPEVQDQDQELLGDMAANYRYSY